MHKKFIPNVIRHVHDNSITLSPQTGQVNSVLIWLHGLCDTSQGFYSFFMHSHSPLYQNNMRIRLLQAPLRRITINSNLQCHAWYNMHSLDRFKQTKQQQKNIFDFNDIEDSLSIVKEQIDRTADELYKQDKDNPINPYHRIYLGGFSQGGVIALHHSLQSSNILGGAISFSGYALKSFEYNNFKKLPILLAHGKNDNIIGELEAIKSYQKLLSDLSLVVYEPFEGLQHSVCLQQLDLLSTWIYDMDTMRTKIYNKVKTQKQ